MGVKKRRDSLFLGYMENKKRASTTKQRHVYFFMEPATEYCNDNDLHDRRIRYTRLTDPFGLV